MNQQPQPKRPTGGSVLLLIVVLVGVMMITPTIQQVIAQRQHISELEAEIKHTEEQIKQIEADSARWEDPAYVRAQARGRLLFVQPGDTTYVVVDDARPAAPTKPVDVSPHVHKTNTDPAELYLDSLLGAVDAGAPAGTDASK